MGYFFQKYKSTVTNFIYCTVLYKLSMIILQIFLGIKLVPVKKVYSYQDVNSPIQVIFCDMRNTMGPCGGGDVVWCCR